MTVVLGLNAYHADSSACLLVDGLLVAAAEEERFRRVKHWAGFPTRAIEYCLAEAGLNVDRVHHVAVNSDPRQHLLRKALFAARQRPSATLVRDRIVNAWRRSRIEDEIKALSLMDAYHGKVHRVEHHLAHLMSCFVVSPYRDAAVISVDGFGDFASAAWGVGRGQEVTIHDRVLFPHSMGIFYQALTQFLGFKHYGDEYKVMGLAPYGKPSYLPEMRRIVRLESGGRFSLDLRYFRHHREKVPYSWQGGAPEVGDLYSLALCDLLGPERAADGVLEQRHRDIARSIQAMYQETFFHMLDGLHRATGDTKLCVAGGCGMNSVANGWITRRSPFREVYVQPAAGDAGGAIGAAFCVATSLNGAVPRAQMPHAYWGPSFEDAQIRQCLDGSENELRREGCEHSFIQDEQELCERVAAAIADGKVVGWFQGRMEWGPRALGNRSILGDPRRADMKDILNLKIKRRESFRPFAPSVLREHVSNWFELDDDVPFMMKVFPIAEDKRERIPAVTHVDGTGRLQTVTEADNSRYHRLIAAFHSLTGVPMVLNTSFNENEPVVCRPQEAMACFLRTKMDVLVLGDHLVLRPD